MTQHLITVPIPYYLSKYDLEGSEEDVVSRIRDLFARARTEHDTVLFLDWSPHEWDDGEDLMMYTKRPENDEEQTKRLRNDAQRVEFERRQYEALRAKFEGK